METLYKSFKADSVSEDGGTITGYASTWDREPDSYGDVVAKGAFAESLEKWAGKDAHIPFLFGHRTDDPAYNIGWCEAEEDERGLRFTAHLDADSEKAQQVRRLYKEGRIHQFSFAYAVLDAEEVELDGGVKANELRKLDLYEVSAVQIPANQHAEVVDVKEAVCVPTKQECYDAIAKAVQDATGFAVQGIEVKTESDALPEVTISAVAYDGFKAGRRNSKRDADDLARIADLCGDIQSIVNGLLDRQPDEQADEAEADGAEAKAEEPDTANAEEPQAKAAEADALLQQANEILGKGDSE